MLPVILNSVLILFVILFVGLVFFAVKYAIGALTEKTVEERQREAVAGYGKQTQTRTNIHFRR